MKHNADKAVDLLIEVETGHSCRCVTEANPRRACTSSAARAICPSQDAEVLKVAHAIS